MGTMLPTKLPTERHADREARSAGSPEIRDSREP